jgi:nuclear GTP-binding protein
MYKTDSWENAGDFLEKLSLCSGKLLEGGEADLQTVGKVALNEQTRGRIPFFLKLPSAELPKAPRFPLFLSLEVAPETTHNNPEEETAETIGEGL